MIIPKLIITDIDGVWTDTGMYYDQQGNELKKFSTYDGMGAKMCRVLNIPLVVMTGEDTEIVSNRCKKLKIEDCYQGVENKLLLAKTVCASKNIDLKDVAFIGDDWNDFALLSHVGFSACPANARKEIKDIVHKQLSSRGGEGAFREFVEYILSEIGLLEKAFKQITNT